MATTFYAERTLNNVRYTFWVETLSWSDHWLKEDKEISHLYIKRLSRIPFRTRTIHEQTFQQGHKEALVYVEKVLQQFPNHPMFQEPTSNS